MRKFLIPILLTWCAVSSSGAMTARQSDEAGVRAAVELYFRAQATGEAEHLRRAFHPDAKLFFIRDGKFSQLTLDEFAARFTGKPQPDEAKRKRSVERIDITGNAATAKLILDYPNAKFTDYMALLKIGDEWKIVNKTFTSEPKPSAKP